MNTDLQNKFKDGQISVWEQEQVLHSVTQGLLYDLLSAMSKEELKQASELEIQLECEQATITTIGEVTPSYIVIEEFCELVKKSISDLNQHQQKQIIDEIMINVFNI